MLRTKEATLWAIDPIEVYLAYPVQLKEALCLPIDIESMLYFALYRPLFFGHKFSLNNFFPSVFQS